MPVTNLLKPTVDLPVFEWMRFGPTATTANDVMFVNEEKNGSYIYGKFGNSANVYWSYDIKSDTWFPSVVNISNSCSTTLHGFTSFAISATSDKLRFCGFSPSVRSDTTLRIKIISGFGAGQVRTITSIGKPVVVDTIVGVPTVGAPLNSFGVRSVLQKSWIVNQYVGYGFRLNDFNKNTNASQLTDVIFPVISNTSDTLIYYDRVTPNQSGLLPSNSSVGGVTTTTRDVEIVYSELTVDQPWIDIPDSTSLFEIVGGDHIYSLAPASVGGNPAIFSPLYNFSAHNNLSNNRPAVSNISFTTPVQSGGIPDVTVPRPMGGWGMTAYVSGSAQSSSSMSLTITGVTLSTDRYANHRIDIVSGPGAGQNRRIVGHTNDKIFIEREWDVLPGSTSSFEIRSDYDKLWVIGVPTALSYYSRESGNFMGSHLLDWGTIRTVSVKPYVNNTYASPYDAYGLTGRGILAVTGGCLTASIVAGGTGYRIGDKIGLAFTGGTGGSVFVTSVGSSGTVTGIVLSSVGVGYNSGNSRTALLSTGSSGTGLVLNMTSGTAATLFPTSNIMFQTGSLVSITGISGDSSYNGVFNVIGLESTTGFCISVPNAVTVTGPTFATIPASRSLLVDVAKNWDTNEHTGKLLFIQQGYLTPNGGDFTPGTSIRCSRIVSNTTNSLTISGGASNMNVGTTRYFIAEPKAFGSEAFAYPDDHLPFGWASTGSTNTLVDPTKNWDFDYWKNYRVRVVCGDGLGNEATILTNDLNKLTISGSWPIAVPTSYTKYEIMDSFGFCTTASAIASIVDTNKNFPVGAGLSGKSCSLIANNTTTPGMFTIQSPNTATGFNINTSATVSTDTLYAIYRSGPDSTGTTRAVKRIEWLYGLQGENKGRWLVVYKSTPPQGFMIYDIPNNRFIDLQKFNNFVGHVQSAYTTTNLSFSTNPIPVNFICYDGDNTIYFHIFDSGRIFSFDFYQNNASSVGTVPYGHQTPTASAQFALGTQLMDIVKTTDGLKYLYMLRMGGREMWRTLLLP